MNTCTATSIFLFSNKHIVKVRIDTQIYNNIPSNKHTINALHFYPKKTAQNRRAARCILPVSKNTNLPTNLGLRHRAAAGITAQSDAIAIIVSEQTGEISCSIEGKITTNLMPVKLKDFIEKEMEG